LKWKDLYNMSLAHSPQIVTNGLAFYYDMGNPQKSWKGATTTNLIDVAENLLSANWTKEVGFGTVTANYGIAPDGSQTSTRLQYSGGYFYRSTTTSPAITALTAGTTVTFSCWVRGAPQTGRGIGLWSYAVGGIVTASTQAISTYSWTRVSLTYTIAAGATSFAIMLAGDPGNIFKGDIEVWRPQLEVQGFVTPYVLGTRSNTQALVDLTNNNTITATSLTYANDGTFNFNGSSDYLTIPNTTLGNGNVAWTVSCWMKTTTTTNSLGQGSVLSNISGGPVYSMMGVNNGKIVYWTYQNNEWTQKLGVGTTVNDGNWHMLTWVNYANYTMDMYVDGILDSNVANSTSGNNNPVDVIGRSWAGYFPGSIASLSRYTRSLTASEVQQNFNALRGRYGR
jgi:hypothetical protein